MCFKGEGNRQININHRLRKLRDQARDLLDSELGRAHRIKRCIEPESVFGQLKWNNGFTRFTLRGLDKVEIELALMAIGHNLRKLIKTMFRGQNPGNLPEFEADQSQSGEMEDLTKYLGSTSAIVLKMYTAPKLAA